MAQPVRPVVRVGVRGAPGGGPRGGRPGAEKRRERAASRPVVCAANSYAHLSPGDPSEEGLASEDGDLRERFVGLLRTRCSDRAQLPASHRLPTAAPRASQLRGWRLPGSGGAAAAQPAPTQRRRHAGHSRAAIPPQPHRAGGLLW